MFRMASLMTVGHWAHCPILGIDMTTNSSPEYIMKEPNYCRKIHVRYRRLYFSLQFFVQYQINDHLGESECGIEHSLLTNNAHLFYIWKKKKYLNI